MSDPALAAFEAAFGPEFGHGKAFDVARLKRALSALGDPQTKLAPLIHVAGTNGKGSTIAFMRAIAEAAGLKIHAFTKPHLLRLNERFVVAGAEAEDAALAEAARRVAAIDPGLTQFDAQVAAAFLLFSETPADLVLLETGMGGATDSTNVIEKPALTLITPVALDHQDALGERLSEIAAHKAGVLKPGIPAFIARQFLEARHAIEKRAAEIDAPLYWQGEAWQALAQAGRMMIQTEDRALDLPLPALYGAHQIDNAGLAIAALLFWRPDLDENALSQGLQNAIWPGRLQPLLRGALRNQAGDAEIWIDGGHNAHAARALSQFLARREAERPAKTAIILGLKQRKDARGFLEQLKQTDATFFCVPLREDGADPKQLAAAATYLGMQAEAATTLEQALAKARAEDAARILICGSLALAGEALNANGGA